MSCKNCGWQLPAGTAFCTQCGAPLAGGEDALRRAGWTVVPGPANRESFYRAQRRHRRATWRLAFISAIAALLTGIPMSIALTPVLFALAVVFTWATGKLVPVPQEIWDFYISSGRVLIDIVESLDDPATAGVSEGDISRVPVNLIVRGAIVWLVPGMLFMLGCWVVLRALFRHGGAGGVLLTLGAREPRPGDFEERQLVNVVEEIAIAAGLPAPRVMLLDSGVANAAVVGSGPRDATLVVSRALLEDLDRDATQGVLANLVASIGNGDLRGARSILAVFETFGLAGVLLKAPISRPARRMLWRIVRYVFGRHSADQRASEARAVSGMLSRSFWEHEESDMDTLTDTSGDPGQRRGPRVQLLMFIPILVIGGFLFTAIGNLPMELFWLGVAGLAGLAVLILLYQRAYVAYLAGYAVRSVVALLLLPYYLGTMLPQIALMLVIPFLLEPMLALLWRRRRFLADASAVQLTRNPDAIGRGLVGLVARGGMVPGGHWAAPMFVVGPEAVNARMMAMLREQTSDQVARAAIIADQMEHSGSFSGSESGSVVTFHPPLNRRLRNLRRMGGTIGDVDMSAGTGRGSSGLKGVLLAAIAIPLGLLVVVLLGVALVLLMALSLLFCGILMAVVYGLAVWLAP